MSGESWWRRVGTAEEGFRYLRANGEPVVSEPALRRIRRLAIPPGWAEVRVAPEPGRRLQAWGRDSAGRKQYIYSAEHVEARDRRKWGRVLRIARALPQLRSVTNEHLAGVELCREKVLATVVRLMARAYFRAGSERYAVLNRTFGICTLCKAHVRIDGDSLFFTYTGKRRVDQRRVVADTPLVGIIREVLELPGERLFQYIDEEGRVRGVTPAAVNRYLERILGARYTSKDLRTFGGTVRAATILADIGPAAGAREAKKNVVLCSRLVAAELGNTPAIARRAYIHPVVLERYEAAGLTIEPLMRLDPRPVAAREPAGHYPEEEALIRFLEKYG